MLTLKKSRKKENKKSHFPGKKLTYALLLLLGANIIVFSFFSYFIYKLYASSLTGIANHEIYVAPIPKIKNADMVETTARSHIVYDPVSRTVVISKNPKLRLSPASSIKILTALVALDAYMPEQYLTVNVTATFDESKMGLFIGEEIDVRSLLYGLLLISGNDAAKNLANHYPGGAVEFIKAMNIKAKEIGLSESNFLDPSGYLDNNYSTAFDMALLGAHAMKDPTIREIVKTQRSVVYDRYKLIPHPLINLNELLVNENVTGVKTGFTNEAGGVLVTSYMHKGRELIIIVMKSNDRFADTKKLIDAVSKNVYFSDPVGTN